MILSDISVKRPVFATVLSLLLVAFGLLSFSQISVRELPDVDPPIVSVETRYPGANARVVETRVTQIIESAIAGVEGIRSISSSSSDGRSNITIEFTLDRDIDSASNDVRDRVSRTLNALPEEVDPPEVSKADNDAQPIMWFNLISDTRDTLALTDYAERNIVDRLSVVDGVSSVRIGGARRQAMRINLDREAMAARNITVQDIENALRAENIESPAGKVESINRDTIVRLSREYATAGDFSELVIRREGADGSFVRIADIAGVELGGERDRSVFHGNGKPVIGLGIVKQSKANALEVTKAVMAEVERLRENLPQSMELLIAYNSAQFIEDSVREVYYTLAIAMGLVILILYIFLGNIRTVLVPIVTVPVSIIASFFVLAGFGVSINLITLLGLVLAIGLVVDDAIVVLENIYRRVEAGEPGLLAAYRGARQVGFAVIATTLVLIGVFVPIIFLTGDVSRLFGELAITMAATIAFSSLIALTLSPVMCSLLVRRRDKKPAFAKMLDRIFHRIQEAYGNSLVVCLNNKVAISAIFLTCFGLISAFKDRVPEELAPVEDRSYLLMSISGPEGASIGYMENQVARLEEQILPLLKTGELVRLLLRVDSGGGFGFAILTPNANRDRSAGEIANELRGKLNTFAPGVRAFPFQTTGLNRGGGGSELQFVIGADTYEELGRYAEIIMADLRTYPGIVNPDIDYRETQPQFDVNVDRERAADLGVSIADIGRTLETMMGGRRVTTFQQAGEEYDVIVQAKASDRQQPLDMENIYARSREGDLVPLSSVLDVEATSGAGNLRRFNRVRALTVSGSVAPGYSLGQVIAYMENLVREKVPDVTSVDYKGATRDFKQAGDDIYFIFGLALVVVFLVMAAQFESFIHPMIIMLTVPLAVLGGLMGLYFTGSTLNIYSQIGMIMLIGLAAKNGILIVEFANQLRDEGLSDRDALLEASKTRLRPIMMTGLSTAIGAVPLIIADGAGSAARQTIGVVVFGGVIVATFFTLFIVPTFYDLLVRYTRSPNTIARDLQKQQREEGDILGEPGEQNTPKASAKNIPLKPAE